MRLADFRSLAFVVVTIASLLAPFFLAPLSIVAGVGFFFANTALAFVCTLVTHNQIHCATFSNRHVNRVFDFLLTFARGGTVTGMIVPHALNHHPTNGNEDDWIRTSLAREGWYPMRMVRYTFTALKSVATQKIRPGSPQLSAEKKRHLVEEKIILWSIIVGLLIWNPLVALTLVGIPWITAMLALIAATIPQHDGCDPLSLYDHSRNFTSPVANWLFMNNGYHTVHHLFPDRHWSELPETHEKIAPLMRSELNERGFLPYLLRQSFGRRSLHAVDEAR
jgi:beta-carotene hydroxylase